MDLSKHFGAAVREHRTMLALTQEELADRAGSDRAYLNGIENGKRNPSLRALQNLSSALGIDLDLLFATARQIALKKADKP